MLHTVIKIDTDNFVKESYEIKRQNLYILKLLSGKVST